MAIKCNVTECEYNNSCCVSPHNSDTQQFYCKKQDITIMNGECTSYELSADKKIMCYKCQIKKNKHIKMPRKLTFEKKDIIEDLI